MSTNDKIYSYLRGLGLNGSINDMLYKWYSLKGVDEGQDYYLTRTSLFASGQQGVWYDPSNLNTLFQDSAGDVPVTAMEQPVGRMLDLSWNGNHAFQATSTKRGVVSRRVNLLTNTEFAGAVAGTPGTQPTGWTNNAVTGEIVSTTGGIRIACDGGARRSFSQSIAAPAQVMTYELTLRCLFNSATPPFNLVSAVSAVVASATVYLDGVAFPGFGTAPTGEHIVKLVVVTNGTAGSIPFAIGVGTSAGAFTSDVTIYSASVALAIDANLPYQRINTSTDYDADPYKFPTYILFDGVDDAYQTNSIDFTVTDKMTVWAGVTKLSDAATQSIVELSDAPATKAGTFWISTSALTTGDIWSALASSASVRAGRSFSAPAPSTGVLSTAYDFAGATREDEIKPRWNGAVPVLTGGLTADAGSGPFGTHPLYIGARAPSMFFNGRLYGLIVAGDNYPLSQTESVEYYMKRKMMLP